MRGLLSCVAVVVLLIGVGAVPWTKDATGLPPGPFKRGCGGCVVNEEANVMRCEDCMDGMRALTCSEIALDKCKSFMNDDGALECTKSAMDNSNENGQIPGGPYLEDCGGCLILPAYEPEEGTVLECTECPDDKGFFHIAQMPFDLKKPCPEVLNVNGKLFCSSTYKKGMETVSPRDEEYDNRAHVDDKETEADIEAVEAELAKRLEQKQKPVEQPKAEL